MRRVILLLLLFVTINTSAIYTSPTEYEICSKGINNYNVGDLNSWTGRIVNNNEQIVICKFLNTNYYSACNIKKIYFENITHYEINPVEIKNNMVTCRYKRR